MLDAQSGGSDGGPSLPENTSNSVGRIEEVGEIDDAYASSLELDASLLLEALELLRELRTAYSAANREFLVRCRHGDGAIAAWQRQMRNPGKGGAHAFMDAAFEPCSLTHLHFTQALHQKTHQFGHKAWFGEQQPFEIPYRDPSDGNDAIEER